MESPFSWGPVEKTIHEALEGARAVHELGLCGWSTEMQIANALREAGLVVEDDDGNLSQDSNAI